MIFYSYKGGIWLTLSLVMVVGGTLAALLVVTYSVDDNTAEGAEYMGVTSLLLPVTVVVEPVVVVAVPA